uniref:Uncharacterized protein n=1 Tax=Meloidogyne enterolobii TaxID=390850 RepID=A0A6V7WDE3_MELEN|nr:unnamed protein product [Meloidogyne enterolobii]
MAKRTRKFIRKLKNIRNELDNENIFLKDLKKLKKLYKLKTMKRMLEELKKEVKEEDEAYRDRFISKFEFLDKNWKEFVKSNKKLTKLAEDGHLFIGYCLANRFQFIFNNEGQAKTKFYEETNSHLFNYASEINQILGNRRVNLEFYKKQANNFKEKILSKCEIQEEDLEEIVSNICEIDRDNVKFEHPEEWNLQISKTILDGDFHLADMKFIGVEESDLEHLNLGSGEWFDLKKGALDLFNLNKLTFTEAHLIISSLHEILKKNKTTIKKEELKEHLKNVKTIYWKAKLEIEKSKQIKNNQQKLIVKKELTRIETSIEFKEKLNECLVSVYVLKFFVLQKNNRENDLLDEEKGEKEEEEEIPENIQNNLKINEKLFLNFQNKCENIEKIKKMWNSKKLNSENLIKK